MKNQFEKVFDARHRRIRGLWIRNGIYYAQLRLDGTNRASRVPIQGAETVPQAIAGMQGLKHERANGELQLTPVRNVPTLAEVGAKFLANAKALGLLSERTRDIYQHSFKRFAEFGSDTPATKIDAVWVNRYQLFRAKKQVNGRPLKGRTIDIEMNALRCALKFAVEQRLI